MKKTYIIISGLALLALGMSSCANIKDYAMAPNAEVGSVGQSLTGTVISANTLRAEADSTSKNMGTGLGAVIGAGAGALLGGGTGQIVSSAGFGALGAIAGREIGKAVSESTVQRLVIQTEKNGNYTITQPIYAQFGEIQVGTTGVLTIRAQHSTFEPY